MANEKRLIDLDELIAHFRKTKVIEVIPNWEELNPSVRVGIIRTTAKYREIVLSASIVDAMEVVHGRWVYEPVEFDWKRDIKCSICGEYVNTTSNYCPNCGAKMDGDGNA